MQEFIYTELFLYFGLLQKEEPWNKKFWEKLLKILSSF